jgi:hypothetical protein
MRKRGLSFNKIGDDVIAQKPMTSCKQIARHRMAFFEIKSTVPAIFSKKSHIAIISNFVLNFMFTLYRVIYE